MTKTELRHYVFYELPDYKWYFAPDGRKRGTERKILGHSKRLAPGRITFKPTSWGRVTLGLDDMECPSLADIRKKLAHTLEQAGLL